jgi:hypothetical protein
MELVVVEFDTGTELDATECAKLVGGTDLGSGRSRWMEHSRNGRREYGQGTRGSGGGSAGERLGRGQRGQNSSCDREQGRTT